MMCYRDRQWCTIYAQCAAGEGCDRAFTTEVEEAAEEWWEEMRGCAPVDFFAEIPRCFVQKRTIVCSALKYNNVKFDGTDGVDGIIVTGPRHFDKTMIRQIKAMGLRDSGPPEQGFIDQFGVFVNRTEAMEIVKFCGQRFNAERNGTPADQLFSEGLY